MDLFEAAMDSDASAEAEEEEKQKKDERCSQAIEREAELAAQAVEAEEAGEAEEAEEAEEVEENDEEKENDKETMTSQVGEKEACAFEDEINPPPPELPAAKSFGVEVLPPDHPLMQRFQQKLRDYMERIRAEGLEELADLRYEIKQKEAARDAEGVRLYDVQTQLKDNTKEIQDYEQKLKEQVETRLAAEESLEDLKAQLAQKQKIHRTQQYDFDKRVMELEHLATLETNIRQWSQELEDEVKTAKRTVDRDAQLQKQISEEKKKSDLIFYHLDVEISKREKELESLRGEMCDMKEVISVLNQSVSYATTDLEVLQGEHKQLSQAWSEVITAIKHRDKVAFEASEAVHKQKEQLKLAKISITAIKKLITKEMKQNEMLKAFKMRLTNDFTALKRECHKQLEQLSILENELEQLPLLMERTEKDFQEAKKEGNVIDSEIRRLQVQFDKKCAEKYNIEEHILKLAQEQLIADKAGDYRRKLLVSSQDKRRHLELAMAQAQNQLGQVLLDLELLKNEMFKLTKENEKLMEKFTATEQKANQLSGELQRLDNEIEIKMLRIDKLNKKFDDLQQSAKSGDVSTTEHKIRILEKTLQNAEQQIREHQQFWLMLQNHYVNLSQKRNDQLKEIQVTRKQLAIIKQKTLKIDFDLEESDKKTEELNRDIQRYTTKIFQLNKKISERRMQHEQDEDQCEMDHIDLLERLKEREMEVLRMEAEINDLSQEIDNYKDIVLEKHREALSWETKYKMIDETRNWQREERMRDSEIGTMRAEIHRMKIRHAELKRAQEKLSQDMAHCVTKREKIYNQAITRRHKDASAHLKLKQMTAAQKVTDLRSRLRQVKSDVKHLTQDSMVELSRDRDRLKKSLKVLQDKLDTIITESQTMQQNIAEGKIKKQQNLEYLIRKQNHVKAFQRLQATPQVPHLRRSETTLQLQIQKQHEVNDQLHEVIQIVATEHPELSKKLEPITKTLAFIKDE